jgi:hypothetical protein
MHGKGLCEAPPMKAHLKPRPFRVAYLVEENEHWRMIFDAIFVESFGRWGGRFTLIVPCENGAIRPGYIPWLRAYDADILYSYVDFNEATVERLHEQFGPAFLVRHDFHGSGRRDQHAFRPKLPIAPLTALSVTAVLTRGNMFSPPSPVALVDTHPGASPSRFLQETFGCYGHSLSPWPIARDMAAFLTPITFVPKHIAEDPRLVPRGEGDIVSSARVAWSRRKPAELSWTGADFRHTYAAYRVS